MDVLKAALFAVMAVSLGLMWHERAYVLDAYRQDDDGPAELRLSGVALDFEKAELPASPYAVHTAPDTRRRPMALLFTAPDSDPVEMSGGEARISGVVRVEGEPAAGAVVRLERHTSVDVGRRDVVAGGDGRFTVRNLPGGRYRVRAWVPGLATMTASDVFFLDAEDARSRSYDLQLIDLEPRVGFVNGGTMTVGLTGSFGVVISRNDVDDDGIVVTVPVPGVEVAGAFSSDVSLFSPATVTTDDRGLAQFRLRCLRPGVGRATVTIGDDVRPVALADCVPMPPTTQPPDGAAPSDPDPSDPDPSDAGSPGAEPSGTGRGPTTTTPGPAADPKPAGGGNG